MFSAMVSICYHEKRERYEIIGEVLERTGVIPDGIRYCRRQQEVAEQIM